MGRGLFVVFEGIDGSGKTSISSRAAKELRKQGLTVEHVREDGELASRISNGIREFTRDARNLALVPLAELMLYAAREAQLVTESTIPALERAQIVIADRFVYTAQLLATAGRGVDEATALSVARVAAAGVEPDLVILVDTDPAVARARRRISKLLRPDEKAPSRKGLTGGALNERLAAGYRRLAERDPKRWYVLENSDRELDEAVAHTVALIGARARGHALPPPAPRPRAPAPRTVEAASQAFLSWVDARAVRDPALAAWFLGSVPGPEAAERRVALSSRAPEVIAAGLRGLADEASLSLRESLASRAPGAVARSLIGMAGGRVEALLDRIEPLSPEFVARALDRRDDSAAWQRRDRMAGSAPEPVLASLRGLDSARSWLARDSFLARADLNSPRAAAIAAKSIGGVGGDRAWRLRDSLFAAAPVAVLESLEGLGDARSFDLRRAFVSRAPRPVMLSLGGLDVPEAFQLRLLVCAVCKEAIDSLAGLPSDDAWRMRETNLEAWAAASVRSAIPLPPSTRVDRLLTLALERGEPGVRLWKQVFHVARAPVSAGLPRQETA